MTQRMPLFPIHSRSLSPDNHAMFIPAPDYSIGSGSKMDNQDPSMHLAGKTAVITGAGSGIGRATSIELARRGANICVADFSEEGGIETVETIKKKTPGCEVLFQKTDVRNEEQVKELMAQSAKEFGGFDILFNNAGIYEWFSVENIPTDVWKNIIETNLYGIFYGTKHAIPYLKSKGGSIVNTSSTLGLFGSLDSVAYCASKSGVIGLTKASALDLAKYRIRVNCIAPGSIDTPMVQRELSNFGDAEKAGKAYNELYPMGRIGKPEEIAKLVAFLASDDSSFITGSTYLIDGGLSAQWGEALEPKIKVE